MNHEAPDSNKKPSIELLPQAKAHTAAPDQVRSAIHALKEIQRPSADEEHAKETVDGVAADKDLGEVSQGGAAMGKTGGDNIHKQFNENGGYSTPQTVRSRISIKRVIKAFDKSERRLQK